VRPRCLGSHSVECRLRPSFFASTPVIDRSTALREREFRLPVVQDVTIAQSVVDEAVCHNVAIVFDRLGIARRDVPLSAVHHPFENLRRVIRPFALSNRPWW
jgi:hypothetical protein